MTGLSALVEPLPARVGEGSGAITPTERLDCVCLSCRRHVPGLNYDCCLQPLISVVYSKVDSTEMKLHSEDDSDGMSLEETSE